MAVYCPPLSGQGACNLWQGERRLCVLAIGSQLLAASMRGHEAIAGGFIGVGDAGGGVHLLVVLAGVHQEAGVGRPPAGFLWCSCWLQLCSTKYVLHSVIGPCPVVSTCAYLAWLVVLRPALQLMLVWH